VTRRAPRLAIGWYSLGYRQTEATLRIAANFAKELLTTSSKLDRPVLPITDDLSDGS
jgi:hypothetical protein